MQNKLRYVLTFVGQIDPILCSITEVGTLDVPLLLEARRRKKRGIPERKGKFRRGMQGQLTIFYILIISPISASDSRQVIRAL